MGQELKISINDNGIGIPAEFINKVFQHLFITKLTGQGTDLDLLLAYGIINNEHNGILSVESEPGEVDFHHLAVTGQTILIRYYFTDAIA